MSVNKDLSKDQSFVDALFGRALADAGYGLQFCMEPDPTPVDMGQTPFAAVTEMFEDPEPFTPVPIGVNGNYSVNAAAQSNRPAPQPVQQQQYQPIQPQLQNVPQYNANRYTAPVQPQTPTFTHQTPVDEINGKCRMIVDAFDMDDGDNPHVRRGHINLAWLRLSRDMTR